MKSSRQRKGGSSVKVPATLGIGNAKADVRIVEIDNPHYSRAHEGASGNPRTITVAMNANESSISRMGKVLDDSQKKAADRFRYLYETVGGKGAGSFDYSRESVDGGGAREAMTDRQVDAGLKLRECEAYLGRRHYWIVRAVAGEGRNIPELFKSHRERTTWADYLKHGLDDLAELWGMKTKRKTVA